MIWIAFAGFITFVVNLSICSTFVINYYICGLNTARLTKLEEPRTTFVEHLQIQSTLSKTDTSAEIGTGNSVLLREML